LFIGIGNRKDDYSTSESVFEKYENRQEKHFASRYIPRTLVTQPDEPTQLSFLFANNFANFSGVTWK
jgi:hypothetical protein